MDSHILRRQGFSLIELSIVMGVIAVLGAAIIPMAIGLVEIKAGEKTIAEIVLIQEAAHKFFKEQKLIPESLAQLQERGYVSKQWSLLNPWNSPYEFLSTDKILEISTSVPENIAQMVQFRMPQSSVDESRVIIVSGWSDIVPQAIEPGVIVAWYGAYKDIPSGWALCDGKLGTPDLRDKFIVGAREYKDGQQWTTDVLREQLGKSSAEGGSVKHGHGRFTGGHQLNIKEMPRHSHGYYKPRIGGRYDGHSSPLVTDMTWEQGEAMGGDEAHNHSISIDYHVPPYFALAYIMKLP